MKIFNYIILCISLLFVGCSSISVINNRNDVVNKNSIKKDTRKLGRFDNLTHEDRQRIIAIEKYRLMRLGKYREADKIKIKKVSKNKNKHNVKKRNIQKIEYKYTGDELREIDQNLAYYCIAKEDYFKKNNRNCNLFTKSVMSSCDERHKYSKKRFVINCIKRKLGI